MKYNILNKILLNWKDNPVEDNEIIKSNNIQKSVDASNYYGKLIWDFCNHNVAGQIHPAHYSKYWLSYDSEHKFIIITVYDEGINNKKAEKIEYIPYDYCLMLGDMYIWHMKHTPYPPYLGVSKYLHDRTKNSDWDLPELVFSNDVDELRDYWKEILDDRYFHSYKDDSDKGSTTKYVFKDRLYNYTLSTVYTPPITPIYGKSVRRSRAAIGIRK